MKKVVFLGSKEVGTECFRELLTRVKQESVEVLAVLSNNRVIDQSSAHYSVAQLAEDHQIPLLHDQSELLEIKEQIDFIISVQYHQILSAEVLSLAKVAAINLHMAPLPDYRGCNQFSFAIIDNAKEFGTTLHLMTPGIDNGDIISEKRWSLPANIDVKSLYEKTLKESIQLFKDSIDAILEGTISPTPQKNFKAIRPSHFHLRREINAIKEIDLSWSDEKIDRYVRATFFPPFDPPFAIKNGKKVNLTLNWKKDLECA